MQTSTLEFVENHGSQDEFILHFTCLHVMDCDNHKIMQYYIYVEELHHHLILGRLDLRG